MEASQPRAGWYADPYERYRYRYWDGTAWSSYAANDRVEWDEVVKPVSDIADTDAAPAMRGVATAFIGYFGGLLLGLGVALALDRAGQPGGRTVALILSQLGLWSGLLGACVVVSRRRGSGSLLRDFNWRFRKLDVGLGIAGSIAARIVSGAVIAPLPVPFRHPQTPDRDVFDRVANRPIDWIVLILIVCVGAPLIEELFFRGLLQPRLVEKFGAGFGLPMTALLFGAAHLTNWQGLHLTLIYVVSIAGAGFVLGLIRHVTNRLGTSTWTHAWFNIQAVTLQALLR